MTTIGHIAEELYRWAPTDTAESWDNVGLLVGDTSAPVSAVLVTLDITVEAIEKAKQIGAQLIVSHHPVIFRPLSEMSSQHPVYQLAAAGIGALCLHTNLDKAEGGVSDALAQRLGLSEIQADGCVRIGRLMRETSPKEWAKQCTEQLHTSVFIKEGNSAISRVAVCGGAGMDELLPFLGCVDAVLTGEIKHHEWPTDGTTAVAAGHYATEQPIVPVIAARLQQKFPHVMIEAFDSGCPYKEITEE